MSRTANGIRFCRAVGLASSLVVVTLCLKTRQSLYSDPAWQLASLEQYVRGVSPSPNHLVQASPQDISHSDTTWITSWPPATQLLVLPLARAGLSLASAVRLLASVALVVGCLGWVRWFEVFDLPGPMRLGLAAGLPWLRYVSNPLFLYSAEILSFAVTPWLLFVVLRLGERANTRGDSDPTNGLWVVGGGLALGSAYLVKYSLVFVVLGGLLHLLIGSAIPGTEPLLPLLAQPSDRNRAATSARIGPRGRLFVLVGACALLPVLGLSLVNRLMGGALNSATASLRFHWSWRHLLNGLADPALAASDAASPLQYLLFHPVHGIAHDEIWQAVAGVPAGLMLIWLLARSKAAGGGEQLAVCLIVATTAGLLAIWTFTGAASYEPRHFAPAGLAVLPMALAQGARAWRTGGAGLRKLLVSFATAYVLCPMLYGIVSIPVKLMREPKAYRAGPSGFRNPFLAVVDVQAVRAWLLRDFDDSTDVWYLTEPISTLDLPGRVIVRHADFMDSGDLARERFWSRATIRVVALLPPAFEANGKGRIIRSAFPRAAAWHGQQVPGSNYLRWTTAVAGSVPARP